MPTAYDTDLRSERSFPWIERFYFNDDSPVLNPGVHGANFGAWNARKQFSLLSLANLTHSSCAEVHIASVLGEGKPKYAQTARAITRTNQRGEIFIVLHILLKPELPSASAQFHKRTLQLFTDARDILCR